MILDEAGTYDDEYDFFSSTFETLFTFEQL